MPRFVQQCIRTVEARGTSGCRLGGTLRCLVASFQDKGWRSLGGRRVEGKGRKRLSGKPQLL